MLNRATIKQFFRGDEPNLELICSWCQALKTIPPAALTPETFVSFKRYYSAFSPFVTAMERTAMSEYLLATLLCKDGAELKLWSGAVDHFKQWGLAFPAELQSFIQERLDRCADPSEVIPVLAHLGALADDTLMPPKFKVVTKSLKVPATIPRGIGRALARVSSLPAWSDFLNRALPQLILIGTKIKKTTVKTTGYQYSTQANHLFAELHCMKSAPEWTAALTSACATMNQSVQQDMLAAISQSATSGMISRDGWLVSSAIVINSSLERLEARVRSKAPASGSADEEFFNQLIQTLRLYAIEEADAALVDAQAQRLFSVIDFWAPLMPSPTPNSDAGIQRLNRISGLLSTRSQKIWQTCFRLAGPITKEDISKILSAPSRKTRPSYVLRLSNDLPLSDALGVFNAYIQLGVQPGVPSTPNSYCGDVIDLLSVTKISKVRSDIKDAVLQEPSFRRTFLLDLMAGNILRLSGKNSDPAFPDVDFTPFVRLHRLYPGEMDRWLTARNACYETGRSNGPNQAAFAALYDLYTGQQAMTPDSIHQMAQALSMPVGDYLSMTLSQTTHHTMALPIELESF